MKYFKELIILGLVCVIIFTRSCAPSPPEEEPRIVLRVDTVYVEKPIEKRVYVPSKTKIIYDTVYKYQDVDTAAVLKDYFATKIYNDTIKIGDIGYVAIKDEISENAIVNRTSIGVYTCPEITKTITITQPEKKVNKVFAGFALQGGQQSIGVLGKATLLTKQDNMYGLGFGATSSGLIGQIEMGWKIKIKNK